MKKNQYLQWLAQSTLSEWWHDSAVPVELDFAMGSGAVGLTSNPFLIQSTLNTYPELWQDVLTQVPTSLSTDERAEQLLSLTVAKLASALKPIYDKTNGKQGYACAQVNPSNQGDADAMLAQARRYQKIAPNISIKLPACAAGIEAMEECVAEGMCTTITASFTVPQALAVGACYERGAARARQAGITPQPCFAVLMIGRLDDYLRDIARDTKAAVSEADIRCAGIAVAKHAYELFEKYNYTPIIMPAGLRGTYHVTELAGANMVFSVAPKIQSMLENVDCPFEQKINNQIDPAVLERLRTMREFCRAYDEDGMDISEFLTYGATQRTLSQFVEAGWSRITLAQ